MDGTGKFSCSIPHCCDTLANDRSLTLPLPRKRLSGCACHSPLAHFYIHHMESSIYEIHPFTTITHLASQKTLVQEDDAESSIMIQFLFRQSVPRNAPQSSSQPLLKKSTQWTNKLAALVDEEKGLPNTHHPSNPNKESLPFDALVDLGVETSLRLEGPYYNKSTPIASRWTFYCTANVYCW